MVLAAPVVCSVPNTKWPVSAAVIACYHDQGLIPIKLLVNGCTIQQVRGSVSVDYLHVELDRHDIVLAEGLAVESYLDTGNRAMFANAGLALILHPDFSVRGGLSSWECDACAPLVVVGPKLQTARLRLAERAANQGWSITDDPCVRLVIGGREIFPSAADAGRHVFALPVGSRHFEIRSRTAIPAAMLPQSDDRRQLGVAVARMILAAGEDRRELPVDHPGVHQGWYWVERYRAQMWRWTNGQALVSLPAPVMAGTLIEIVLCRQLLYWSMACPGQSVAA